MVTRHCLDDEGDEARQKGGDQERPDCPHKDLTADNDASQIHILLLLLLPGGPQQPALLRFIQRPRRQRRPVQILQVPAPVVVRGRVRRVYLQRATPRVPAVHAHSFSSTLPTPTEELSLVSQVKTPPTPKARTRTRSESGTKSNSQFTKQVVASLLLACL